MTTKTRSACRIPTIDTAIVNATIGSRIRNRREELDLYQRDIHRMTGLSIGFLSDLEAGKRGLSCENILKIATALGVTPDWFFKPLLEEKRS